MASRRVATIAAALLLGLTPHHASAAAGAQLLRAWISTHIIDNALFVFGPLALLFLFVYGFRAIVESQSDSALTNAGKSLQYGLIGFVIIALSGGFVSSFNKNDVNPLNMSPLFGVGGGVDGILSFISEVTSAIFCLVMTINGIRLVASQGESGEVDKLKKSLAGNIGGVLLMIAATAIIKAVAYNEATYVLEEMGGFVQFLLTIIGITSALAIIGAGVMLIVSVDETMKDRAKKTIIGTAISLALVMSSFTLISVLL